MFCEFHADWLKFDKLSNRDQMVNVREMFCGNNNSCFAIVSTRHLTNIIKLRGYFNFVNNILVVKCYRNVLQ